MLGLYRRAVRLRDEAFTRLSGGAFGAIGRSTLIRLPVRLTGVAHIYLAEEVFIGAGSWLQTLELSANGRPPRIVIGARCQFAGLCTISAARSVELGESVLLARGVYISDHVHGHRDVGRPVVEQEVTGIAPVSIGDGAWLGQNVVVTPGVRIGRGAVVGANSVVLSDIPPFTVAVGAPARVVRHLRDRLESPDPGS